MSLLFHCPPQDTLFYFLHLTIHFPCEMKNVFNITAASYSVAKYFSLLSVDSMSPLIELPCISDISCFTFFHFGHFNSQLSIRGWLIITFSLPKAFSPVYLK